MQIRLLVGVYEVRRPCWLATRRRCLRDVRAISNAVRLPGRSSCWWARIQVLISERTSFRVADVLGVSSGAFADAEAWRRRCWRRAGTCR